MYTLSLSLYQVSNETVVVGNTLSGYIVLAERLNYEERTRYLVIVQANVRHFAISFVCLCVDARSV